MIISAVLSGTAGALLFFLVLVLVAIPRSAKRLECARLRDELVDAARLGQIDVSEPRVFWLIDWFDRVADSGRLITSARHSRKRQESTSSTVSLLNALLPQRQLAPVGPNFPLGPAWPGEPLPAVADGTRLEQRAVRYQRSQLGRRPDRPGAVTGQAPARRVAAAPAGPTTANWTGSRPAVNRPAAQREAPGRAVPGSAAQFRAAPVPAEAAARQALAQAGTTVEVPKPGPPKPAAPKPAPPRPAPPKSKIPRPKIAIAREKAAREKAARVTPSPRPAPRAPLPRLEPPLLEPARLQPRKLDPRRAKVSRQEAPRPDPRRQDVRRQMPAWDQRVDVTGHAKPRGGLVPVTDSIPIPSMPQTPQMPPPPVTLDVDAAAAAAVAAVSGTAPRRGSKHSGKPADSGDLKDQIFALPS